MGSALAVQLATSHSDVPAVVLQSPCPHVIGTVLADPRTKLLPVRLLFHEDFEIVNPVSALKTPKLFLLKSDDPTSRASDVTTGELQELTSAANPPKRISTFRSVDFNGPLYREQLVSFLDQYLR